ncbi:MAG: hypothetical protein OXT09_01860 [Myxococcales bacterium]|nr:hypothetical protein [Myxococcales bacterium]
MRRRIDGGGAARNLYLEAPPDAQQMIAAFDVLVRQTPLVRFGHALANAQLAAALAEAPTAWLLDLGVGTGVQLEALMHELSVRGVERIDIVAVDLPAPGADPTAKLRAVGDRLKALGRSIGLSVRLHPVAEPAEHFEPQRWLPAGSGPCVNAALMLHHLQEPDRRRVLQRIKACAPRLLTLIEPDVDHHQVEFLPRVRQCLAHFGAVFEVLDGCLQAHPAERGIIERAFFGREIENIIAHEAEARHERHERRGRWWARLSQLGFSPLPCSTPVDRPFDDDLRVVVERGGDTLCWRDVPLVTVSAWRPGVAS